MARNLIDAEMMKDIEARAALTSDPANHRKRIMFLMRHAEPLNWAWRALEEYGYDGDRTAQDYGDINEN